MRNLLLAITLLFCINLTAQSVKNIVVHTDQEMVQVKYDLNGVESANYYVNLYYSIDGGMNYVGPLRHVTGDVAEGIKAGTQKEIQWDIFKELNYQNEPIQFKVEAIPNLRKAKPTHGAYGKLMIAQAKYSNGHVIIDFEFLPEIDEENAQMNLKKTPFMTNQNGNQILPSQIGFGSGTVYSNNRVSSTPIIDGVIVSGFVKFKVDHSIEVIPSLQLRFEKNYKDVTYIIRNIPVEK